MHVYYLFNLKEQFKKLYWDNETTLYLMLKEIYNLNNNEIEFAINLLNQLTTRISKSTMDNYLFIKMHKEAFYSKKGKIHYYNDSYIDEVSKLITRGTYIKIITNKDRSSFNKFLSKYSTNFFVCDFKHNIYYFINNEKVLV